MGISEIIGAIFPGIIGVTFKIITIFGKKMPTVQVISAINNKGLAIVRLKIFPARGRLKITRVTSNAYGVALATPADVMYDPAPNQNHNKDLSISMDFLPFRISSEPQELMLSFHLKHDQKSLKIYLHNSFGWFSMPVHTETIPMERFSPP